MRVFICPKCSEITTTIVDVSLGGRVECIHCAYVMTCIHERMPVHTSIPTKPGPTPQVRGDPMPLPPKRNFERALIPYIIAIVVLFGLFALGRQPSNIDDCLRALIGSAFVS